MDRLPLSPTLDPGPARSLSVHPLNWLPTAAGGVGGGLIVRLPGKA